MARRPRASLLIDRDDEYRRLQQAAAQAPQLVVVRGRRRVGKSFLLERALAGTRAIFFQADEQPESSHLELFAAECARLVPGVRTLVFETWDAAFHFLSAQADSGPLTVVLDEFQWLLKAQPALDSILMRHWDQWVRAGTPILVVLSGSALTLMENLLASGSALHGRAGYRPFIEPFDYRTAAQMAPPHASPEDLLRRYAILGGTPQYQSWGGAAPIADVLADKVLRPNEALYEEPLHLLREEQDIRDPGTYLTILRAIAGGATQYNEIVQQAKVRDNAAKMLQRLEMLGYIDKREAVAPACDSRRTSYRISDPFFRFWFRYVLPNRSRLERGRIKDVSSEVLADLDSFMGPVFEDCCRTWLGRFASNETFPTSQTLGSWWSRDGQTEIDIVGMSRGRYDVLGSCKWSVRVPSRALGELLESRNTLGAPGRAARLLLFGRAFSPELQRRVTTDVATLIPVSRLFS